jgi:RHS repeat-associated protein
VSVSATLSGATTITESRDVLVPAVSSHGTTVEIFGYDTDGNLTGDSFWIYRYDGENRMRQIESQSGLPALRVSFVYDFLGRRVRKTVETKPSGSWVVSSVRTFAYDGWHLIAEYDNTSGTAVLQKTYAWGLDKSGSVHGAGGVGGLLGLQLFSPTTKTMLAVNDVFGNVVGLLDGTSGSLEASYEYSPFGEALRSSGPQATANPFRFSTKYYDIETDLHCFGYRYYSTSLGRFISRDPLNEPGRSMLTAPLSGGDIVIWSYVGKMGGTPGQSRDLTPDTSLAKTGLSYSTDAQAGRFRNSTRKRGQTIVSGILFVI